MAPNNYAELSAKMREKPTFGVAEEVIKKDFPLKLPTGPSLTSGTLRKSLNSEGIRMTWTSPRSDDRKRRGRSRTSGSQLEPRAPKFSQT